MYNSSLAITPTYNAFQGLKDNFRASNFLHPDVFAAKLKVTNNPYPTKEDIQQFAIEQNLGTIFFVLEGKVYVLDTKTFTVLAQYPYSYEVKIHKDHSLQELKRLKNLFSIYLIFHSYQIKKL